MKKTILDEYYAYNKEHEYTEEDIKVPLNKRIAFELYYHLDQNRGFDINVKEPSEIDLLTTWVNAIDKLNMKNQ